MQVFDVSDSGSLDALEKFPKGSSAKILLTNAFGPYAQDDSYGSRLLNPMECYHNQVTREQGPFSLRMFHRSYALSLIQSNVSTACTVLDYPSKDRFVAELKDKSYDIIGISAKLPNVTKIATMCRLIRQHQPNAKIVVGGHISGLVNPHRHFDADYLVKGEGVRWFRRLLGDDPDQPIRHPCLPSAINARTMGINLHNLKNKPAAALIPSVGCPKGCNFCSTSATFGGKGNFINFYPSGDDLFDIMCQLENEMGCWSFMVMDENFLLSRERALRLLALMQEHDKSWALYVFSSADTLQMYSMAQLVGLGVSWVWIGLEGKFNQYGKLKHVDTHALVRKLQAHGIRILGSTIIGLEDHRPDNIDEVIDWAVSHNTDFHQFMLYMALDGTPLHAELENKGILLKEPEFAYGDIHGQERFNFGHPHILPGMETGFLRKAFLRDYEVNGPSIMRMAETMMNGWLKYHNHPEKRVRKRFARETDSMALYYSGGLWATRRWFKSNPVVAKRMDRILQIIFKEYGLKARLAAPIVGRLLWHTLRRESKRIKGNVTYEPPTFYEDTARFVTPSAQGSREHASALNKAA